MLMRLSTKSQVKAVQRARILQNRLILSVATEETSLLLVRATNTQVSLAHKQKSGESINLDFSSV